mgnify:FL=1
MTTTPAFKPWDKAFLTYPKAPQRAVTVREIHDDDTVTVTWRTWTQDRGRPNRRRAGYVGPEHTQRVPLARLTARSV